MMFEDVTLTDVEQYPIGTRLTFNLNTNKWDFRKEGDDRWSGAQSALPWAQSDRYYDAQIYTWLRNNQHKNRKLTIPSNLIQNLDNYKGA